jgi:penicillin-binding protein 2
VRQEADRVRSFTRRALFVGGVQTVLFGGLAARLWQLQLEESPRYRLLAEENRVSQRLIIPPRGRIADRAGRPIAQNVPTYRVRVVREQARGLETILAKLGRLIRLEPERVADVLARAQASRAFVPITVREDLTWEEVSRIAVHAPELPGVLLDSGLLRSYPQAEVLAHILGYLGPPNKQDQAADPDPLLTLPDFRMGKNGIESAYDRPLRGRAGLSRVEVNAVGREIRELDRDDGEPGDDLRLSLDLELQLFAFNRLAGELAASAVVVEVDTGAVLALASVPSYDPQVFLNGLSRRVWQELRDNPRTPLVNKCIRGQYPPGSTFKMMTALAGLEEGAISPASRVHCPGRFSLGSARFHCWKAGGHGSLNLLEAIEQSCDVYFYETARRAGVDAIARTCHRFGLGAPLGVDLPGEMPGLIPTREWKREHLKQPWHPGETVVTGIGQGFVLTTPLQLAIMTARLCNGGRAVRPWLVPGEAASAPAPPIDVPRAHLDVVLRGMRDVVHGRRGTARGAQLGLDGIEMGGKTGTSQVRRISRAERAAGAHKRKDRPWKERDHALFVCYAPVAAPRYAVAVIVEHGEGGSRTAAPIAKDIMRKALEIGPGTGELRASVAATRSG